LAVIYASARDEYLTTLTVPLYVRVRNNKKDLDCVYRPSVDLVHYGRFSTLEEHEVGKIPSSRLNNGAGGATKRTKPASWHATIDERGVTILGERGIVHGSPSNHIVVFRSGGFRCLSTSRIPSPSPLHLLTSSPDGLWVVQSLMM
jgi:hypothetical protein